MAAGKEQDIANGTGNDDIEQELLTVLAKLREQFATVYYVDFQTNYAHTYKTNDDYGVDYGNLQTYIEPFTAYTNVAVPEHDRQRVLDALQPAYIMERFKTEESFEIEFEDHSFGDLRYCKFRFIKASEDGTKAVICGTDQTEYVREQKDYQKRLRQNLGIINALSSEYENLFLIDTATGEYSNVQLNSTGMHKEALDVATIHKDYHVALTAYCDNFVLEQDRETVRFQTEHDVLLRETPESGVRSIPYRRIDGDNIYHYQLCSAKFTDEDGTLFLVIGFRNVDAMVRAEQSRSRELATMHAIMSSAEMGTWRIEQVDGVASRMYADGRMLELLGLSADNGLSPEEVYDAWFSRIVPESLQSVLDSVEKMKTGVKDENTYLWEHPSLGERYVRCGGTAIAIPGGHELRGYHYDVDEIVREKAKQDEMLKDALNAAEHASRSKTTFLNNMSHDIRTPMNAIIGYTALAASHIDNKVQVQDYLSKITASSSHLLALINDVLNMSRIESGKVSIGEKEASLPAVMHDIRAITLSSVSAKQLDFFIDAVDVEHEDIICDKLRLQQVLINMLSNAVKFTEPGGAIALRVVEKPSRLSGRAHYEFHVKDNGIGMSKEFQEHIFEPFTREESSTVSGIQGTGLGMAITKNIVDMMGGTITVKSELGIGSEFTMTLDCKISGAPIKYEKIDELQGIRALVADDDSNTAISVSNMLKDIGMRADWTLSGKEAELRAKVAIQESDEYGVYIIDWLMPDMNGIETVRQIRRHIGSAVPIIILSAYDWAEIENEARAAGVTGFVSKPIFMSDLRDILTQPYRAETGIAENEPASVVHYDARSAKVLLVEDNIMNQEIAQTILEQHGFLVDVADDGDKAVEAMRNAKTGDYDLVLMDIQMPHMDGYEATREIRKLKDKAVAATPIIAMTANAFDEDRAQAKEAGMDGYITKPIDIAEMLDVLKSFADKDQAAGA